MLWSICYEGQVFLEELAPRSNSVISEGRGGVKNAAGTLQSFLFFISICAENCMKQWIGSFTSCDESSDVR